MAKPVSRKLFRQLRNDIGIEQLINSLMTWEGL